MWNFFDLLRSGNRYKALFHERNANKGICFLSKRGIAKSRIAQDFTSVSVAEVLRHTMIATVFRRGSMRFALFEPKILLLSVSVLLSKLSSARQS